MRFVFWLAIFTAPVAANAQLWGTGLSGGSGCGGGFAPGRGAMSGSDMLSNLEGRRTQTQDLLESREAQLEQLKAQIAGYQKPMGAVLGPNALNAIEMHFSGRRNVVDYQDCNYAGKVPQYIPGTNQEIYQPPGYAPAGAVARDYNRIPPPVGFCSKEAGNTWAYFAQDNGYVNEAICNYRVPRPPAQRAEACRRALHDYYRVMAQKVKLETQVAALRAELEKYDEQLDRINDQIADGRFCYWCSVQQRGYAQSSIMNGVSPMSGILSSMMGSTAPPTLPFPGPGAYPGNPYPATTPGYMGINNGYYGALPGGIGRGGFTCGNTNPNYLLSPFAQAPGQFLNSTYDPFQNRYAAQLGNPAMQSSLLMPGFGPGFGPVLGNGVNGYTLSNPQAPEFLPYPRQNQYDPLSMYLNQQPYQAAYGYRPYGPAFPASNQFVTGGAYPGAFGGILNSSYAGGANGGYAPAYSSPYAMSLGAPLGNFNYQLELLKYQIQVIQSSPIVGGSSAPAFLPYPGNYGGGPVYRGTQTAPNVIRSW